MPALRQSLRRPETYLAAVGLCAALVVLDGLRTPSAQVAARWYLSAVRLYQRHGRACIAGVVVCRYRPSCSEYSAEAVRRFGIGPGLRLTLLRLASCREPVLPGTVDNVPVEALGKGAENEE